MLYRATDRDVSIDKVRFLSELSMRGCAAAVLSWERGGNALLVKLEYVVY
jgi:hypothetical protein